MSEKSFNNVPKVIAIDGPAASGKSTIGTLIANQLGYICLDTGIMYRAVAFQALKEGSMFSMKRRSASFRSVSRSISCLPRTRIIASLLF